MGNWCSGPERDPRRDTRNRLAYCRDLYAAEDQGHVFEYFDELTEEQRESLVEELFELDPLVTNKIYRDLCVDDVLQQELQEASLEPIDDNQVFLGDSDEQK